MGVVTSPLDNPIWSALTGPDGTTVGSGVLTDGVPDSDCEIPPR